MVFADFISAHSGLLWITFAIAIVMGAVVNKTNFCTMGAVSDVVNMGDNGRMRAWLLAAAVAMIGVALLENYGLAKPDAAFPPYRGNTILLFENLLGGLLFGIGMTLASGCGNKTLIRIGGGNIKSIFVLAIISVIAYFMVNPFPNSDQTLMSLLFIEWTRPLSISLSTKQDLVSVLGADSVRLWVGLAAGLLLAVYALRSSELRGSFDNLLGGIVVGLCVVAFWYISSTVTVFVAAEETSYSLSGYYQEWDMLAESSAGKPAAGRPLAPQSFTFINPMGQAGGYLASGFNSKLLTAGLMALFGVIVGSLLWSIITRSFRIEWFNSVSDVVNHVIGAVLMGFGGVLAMGCTIGQGITGVSTLAIGSFITLISIIFGSALTMKINYYRLVYEEEATFIKALVASLADMKMLPNSLRKLDAV
jgi:hypothetical protein